MLEPQVKRGLLDVCVLAVLCRGESYGYKMIKDLSGCVAVSESTLYPILRRLEAAGSVTVRSVEHNGRLRKIYSITKTGRDHAAEFLQSWGELAAMYEFIKEGVAHDEK